MHHLLLRNQIELVHESVWVPACVCVWVLHCEQVFYQLLPLVWTETWWKPRQTQGNVNGEVKSTDGASTLLGTLVRGAISSGKALDCLFIWLHCANLHWYNRKILHTGATMFSDTKLRQGGNLNWQTETRKKAKRGHKISSWRNTFFPKQKRVHLAYKIKEGRV